MPLPKRGHRSIHTHQQRIRCQTHRRIRPGLLPRARQVGPDGGDGGLFTGFGDLAHPFHHAANGVAIKRQVD